MATSSESVGGARATAARTKSWTGLPSVTSHVARGSDDAGRAVGLEDRLQRGQARAGALGPAAEAGEEMGLDEPGQDAHVRLDVAAVDPHRHAVHASHLDVLGHRGVGSVLMDGVPAGGVGADELDHLLGGGQAVGAGGAQEVHAVGADTESFELGQQRWEDGAVGHGPREVGEHHRHPGSADRTAARPAPSRSSEELRQGRTLDRGVEGIEHGRGLVGQAGQLGGGHDDGVVGHPGHDPVPAVGETDLLHDSTGFTGSPDHARHAPGR